VSNTNNCNLRAFQNSNARAFAAATLTQSVLYKLRVKSVHTYGYKSVLY